MSCAFVAVALASPLMPLLGAAAEKPNTNTVSVAGMLKDLGYSNVKSSNLLAFISREDQRPWYVDDALLLLEFPKGRWTLVHCVRNPRYPKGHPLAGRVDKWGHHDVCDAPWAGNQHFNHRPTRVEIESFLKKTDWPTRDDKFWRITRQIVNEAAWPKKLNDGTVVPVTPKRQARPPQ